MPPGLEPLPGQPGYTGTARKSPPPAASDQEDAETDAEPPTLRTRIVSNPLFGYTHLLPSPLTLPDRRFVIGSDLAYGVCDFFQVGTGLLRDIYQVYNINARLKLIDLPRFTLGVNVEYETFNYHDIAASNPDLRQGALLPGLVAGFELMPRVALFVGGNLSYNHPELPNLAVEQTSGYVHGSQLETDLAWNYNTGRLGFPLGDALAFGTTYDLTYHVAGVGVSHYWRGFKLGLHYYVNADQYRVLPILAGGAVMDF